MNELYRVSLLLATIVYLYFLILGNMSRIPVVHMMFANMENILPDTFGYANIVLIEFLL